MKKTALRAFFSCAVSLNLAIVALGFGLCHYAQSVLCNQHMLLQAAEDSGYTRQLYDEIAYEWENLLAITGVETPEQIMEVLTLEAVNQDALQYIRDAYTGTAAPDTRQLRQQLEARVRAYAASHNIYATPEDVLEENIQALVGACMTSYEGAIAIGLLPKLLGHINRISAVLPGYMTALAIGGGLLTVLLYLLQKKRRDTLYYITISAATGGIVLLGLPLTATYYNVIARLPFSDSAVKSLICQYLQRLLDAFRHYSGIFFQVAGTMLACYLLILIIQISARKMRCSA